MTNDLIKKLKWDSDFFGINIASVVGTSFSQIERSIQEAKDQDIRLLYLSISLDDKLATQAKDNLERFVGDQVVYQASLRETDPVVVSNGYTVQSYQDPSPTESMIELAIESGWSSRFKIDPKFTDAEFHKLYETWIINSCNGKIADGVLIATSPNNELAGLVTVATGDQKSKIGLLAVSASHRRNGLGKALMKSAANYSFEQKCQTMTVGTQLENEGANKLYKNLGFTLAKSESLFHLWLD